GPGVTRCRTSAARARGESIAPGAAVGAGCRAAAPTLGWAVLAAAFRRAGRRPVGGAGHGRRGGGGGGGRWGAGGGAAWGVLAARLSEDPGCEVILLEAGPDLADVADLPPDVVDASVPSLAHDWGYVAEPDRLGRCIALPRAKLIGGCSATNGCFAVRGAPA